jgi:hypothetical protein
VNATRVIPRSRIAQLSADEARACAGCGQAIALRAGYYCCHACRQRDWRARRRAIEAAKRPNNAPIVVAKLDRLSRDVHFISGLLSQKTRAALISPSISVGEQLARGRAHGIWAGKMRPSGVSSDGSSVSLVRSLSARWYRD